MSSTVQAKEKEDKDLDLSSRVSGYISQLSGSLQTKTEVQILILITLFAAFLRIYQLGTESLWLDEASTYRIASTSLFQLLEATSGDVHPPLYYVVVHFFLFLGNSELILRLPSMILGVLSVPVLYFFTTRLFSSKEGLVSAFLLSVSLMHIYYSQEARMYSMLLFLSLCSLYFFYLAMEDNKKIYWVIFSFFTVLNIYTHYFGFFIFPIEILFYLSLHISSSKSGGGNLPFVLKDIPKSKIFTVNVVSVLILIIPRIQVFFEQAASRVGGEVTWGMGQSNFIPILLARFSTFSGSQSILFLLLFVIGIVATLIKSRKQALLLSMWFILPIIVSFYLAGIMPFQPRYLIFILPAFLIFVSCGITAIPPLFISDTTGLKKKKKSDTGNVKLKRAIVTTAIVLIVFLGSVGLLIDYYPTTQKNDWREVSSVISSSTQQGDIIVALPSYMSQPLTYYYDNSTDGTYIISTGYTQDALDATVDATYPNRVFFVLTGDINAANPEGTALVWLQENANVVSVVNGVYILTPNT